MTEKLTKSEDYVEADIDALEIRIENCHAALMQIAGMKGCTLYGSRVDMVNCGGGGTKAPKVKMEPYPFDTTNSTIAVAIRAIVRIRTLRKNDIPSRF